MKASTLFTESEDQYMCGHFKGFEHSRAIGLFWKMMSGAAWFNSEYTLTRQSTFPPAVTCSASVSRSGEMTSIRIHGPSVDTRSSVSQWSFHTSLVSDSHLVSAVSLQKYKNPNTLGDDFRSCFRILGSTADARAHASVSRTLWKIARFST